MLGKEKKREASVNLFKPRFEGTIERERYSEEKRSVESVERSKAVALLIAASFFFLFHLTSFCCFQGEEEGVGSAEMVAQSGTAHRVFPLPDGGRVKEHFSISEARALTYLSILSDQKAQVFI